MAKVSTLSSIADDDDASRNDEDETEARHLGFRLVKTTVVGAFGGSLLTMKGRFDDGDTEAKMVIP